MSERRPRVALVHDWLVQRGGAERVLADLHQLWPEAPIYTAAYEPGLFPELAAADVRTTWFNGIKLARRRRELFALVRGWSFRGLDLSAYDVVISSSSAEAKYVRTGPKTLHICYCYTPNRYYWSDYDWHRRHTSFGILTPVARLILPVLIHYLRWYDYRWAQRVDIYLTQSRYIQKRIERYYHRQATIIHPGIDTQPFLRLAKRPGNYFLVVGRQVPYKRLDLVVTVFNRLGLPLVVAGQGEAVERERRRARPNIEFKGFVPDDQLRQLYANATAVIYPQEEDYGLVPLEAQAAGTPVVALARGGAAETVIDGKTGVLFQSQTPDGLMEAVRRFQKIKFDPQVLRQQAQRFDQVVFKRQIQRFVDQAWKDFQKKIKNEPNKGS